MILNREISVDRYQLAREFAYVKAKDEIQALSDPAQLKEVALGMLKMNYGLREWIHNMAKDEIKTVQLPEVKP